MDLNFEYEERRIVEIRGIGQISLGGLIEGIGVEVGQIVLGVEEGNKKWHFFNSEYENELDI
jgi:hypothetical protein